VVLEIGLNRRYVFEISFDVAEQVAVLIRQQDLNV
jgi:hypothetical protein